MGTGSGAKLSRSDPTSPPTSSPAFGRFLDLSELRLPLLQDEDDNAHLTRQQGRMKGDANKCSARGLALTKQ